MLKKHRFQQPSMFLVRKSLRSTALHPSVQKMYVHSVTFFRNGALGRTNNNFETLNFQGINVICVKRGGDTQMSSHSEWLLTVPNKPDAIDFSFIPITSLLKGAPGRGFLSHAINLYLRCKFNL